jgi:hypothetical protein
MQTMAPTPRIAPDATMLVIDGSRRAASALSAASAALAHVPDGAVLGLIVATEPEMVRIDPAPMNAEHRARLAETLSGVHAKGGQDNLGALVAAIGALDSFNNATLVWVHAPQPVRFTRDAALLEQTLDRSTRLPRLILYPVAPGPNRILEDRAWFWRATSLAATGDARVDLTSLMRDLYSHELQWRVTRVEARPRAVATNRSPHIANLWASDQILNLAATDRPEERQEALRIAAAYRLVTPVSGAVVLETAQDYERFNLTPGDPSQIPTIPEPSTWMMLIVACALLAWMAWRNRRLIFVERA